MSKGYGKVQRSILALIAAEKPDDGWSIEELCEDIYGDSTPTRAQLGAVKRALKMKLPGSWKIGRTWPGRRSWLYDASNADWKMMIEPFEFVELELVEIRLPAEDAETA
jgi:hypothetical protein